VRISFKHIFAIVFSIALCTLGVYFGGRLVQQFGDKGLPPATPAAMGLAGAMMGALLGLYLGDWITSGGKSLAAMKPADKIAGIIGIFLGVIPAGFITLIFFRVEMHVGIQLALSSVMSVVFIYLGFISTISMKTELLQILARGGPATMETERIELNPTKGCKILDTNVIIDGRVHDVCRAGFIEGTLYVPGFVLEELQHIADSSDALKRARGRRGLDILNSMQKELTLVVRSWDKMLEKSAQHDEVDTRLVKLAKSLEGTIVTNDFNLNKVAMLQGVPVLNINELANALKPVVLPGEVMRVGIVKEGKEMHQGVAYLDDGTMIVVEDGRRYLNETREVMVTSVLQTAAGKMIFARTLSDDEKESYDENSTASSSGGFTRRGQGKKVR
jgi:uncharacterized protein YacL